MNMNLHCNNGLDDFFAVSLFYMLLLFPRFEEKHVTVITSHGRTLRAYRKIGCEQFVFRLRVMLGKMFCKKSFSFFIVRLPICPIKFFVHFRAPGKRTIGPKVVEILIYRVPIRV